MKHHGLRFWQRVARILFVAWMLGSAQPNMAAAAADAGAAPTMAAAFQTEAQLLRERPPVQLAGLVYRPTLAEYQPPANENTGNGALRFSRKIRLILLLGGGLLLLGTFFMPHLLPQFVSYQEQWARFREYPARMYQALFQGVPGRRRARADSIAERLRPGHTHGLCAESPAAAGQSDARRRD